MAASYRRLRPAVGIDPGDVDGCDRGRQRLIGDVVDPGKCRRGGPQLGHILVGHHHDAAPLERLRNREAGVGRVREGWVAPIAGDELGLGQIRDVENVDPMMPIADVEAISDAQRTVTARWHEIVPRIGFTTGLPLAGASA